MKMLSRLFGWLSRFAESHEAVFCCLGLRTCKICRARRAGRPLS